MIGSERQKIEYYETKTLPEATQTQSYEIETLPGSKRSLEKRLKKEARI